MNSQIRRGLAMHGATWRPRLCMARLSPARQGKGGTAAGLIGSREPGSSAA
jgi:hypothetical protein